MYWRIYELPTDGVERARGTAVPRRKLERAPERAFHHQKYVALFMNPILSDEKVGHRS